MLKNTENDRRHMPRIMAKNAAKCLRNKIYCMLILEFITQAF